MLILDRKMLYMKMCVLRRGRTRRGAEEGSARLTRDSARLSGNEDDEVEEPIDMDNRCVLKDYSRTRCRRDARSAMWPRCNNRATAAA